MPVSAKIDEQGLEAGLAALEPARAWTPRVVSKLESHIRSAEDEALFRINPFNFASEKNIGEVEAIDLFLHATAVGLFEMSWLLLCPKCSCVVESFRKLESVHNSYHCSLCQADYEAVLDEFIAVTFTISPGVRDISFHHPDDLAADDYFYRFCGTRDGRMPDGTPFVEVQRTLITAITRAPPGANTVMEIEAKEGIVFAGSPEGRVALLYPIDDARVREAQHFELIVGEKVHKHSARNIAPGKLTFAFDNVSGERVTLFLALLPKEFEFGHAPVQFVPFLTGKRLLTTQTFRDLFRSEVIRASEGIGIKDIALLFTDVKGSTALYDRIGDLNAFALVQRHFERLQEVTVRNRGAVIKTIGDAVMAAFLQPADAVTAALEMRAEIIAFNRGQLSKELVLKIGVHKGAAIAVTLNDRLDYFGQTVNIAARVQNLAEADEVVVSEDVHTAEGVATALNARAVTRETARLKGVNQDVVVFRIAPDARSGALQA